MLLRFDLVGEAHRDCHAHGPLPAVLTVVLRLLQVDFGRVEGHVGVELRHVPGPGHRKTVTSGLSHHTTKHRADAPAAKHIFNSKPHGK